MSNLKYKEKNALHAEIDKKLETTLNYRTTRAKIELSTRLGRFLDKLNYVTLSWLIISLVLICALYFFIATSFGEGITVPKESKADEIRWNALYFSIVTFTSLGYGDLSPQGIGKAVASFEVLTGLVLIAVLVGKLASERQSTSLLLLLTSDNQRRLRELVQNLELSEQDICSALTDQDQIRAAKSVERGVSLVASIRKYLTFQANQAQLATFGNTSSLRDLYKGLYEYQHMADKSYKSSIARGAARISLEKIIKEIHAIAEIMVKFHPDDLECKKTFLKIGSRTELFFNWKESLVVGRVKEVFPTIITEPLLIRVQSLLSETNFDKNLTKTISSKLDISRRMAQRCVDELIESGAYKIPAREKDVRKEELFRKLDKRKERVKKKSALISKKIWRENKKFLMW